MGTPALGRQSLSPPSRLTHRARPRGYNHLASGSSSSVSRQRFAVPPKNLICIVVDRLHAGMVGAYGNSWIRTAELDELASESFLFDQAFGHRRRLAAILSRAMWSGGISPHSGDRAAGASFAADGCSAAGLSHHAHDRRARGGPTACGRAISPNAFFLDSPEAVQAAVDARNTHGPPVRARQPTGCSRRAQPFCLWLHARGMSAAVGRAVGAAQSIRRRRGSRSRRDVRGARPVASRGLRSRRAAGHHARICRAGVAVRLVPGRLSRCVCAISPLAENTLLTFLSARGFPLGEHRRVGPCDERLYNETTQLGLDDAVSRRDGNDWPAVSRWYSRADLPGTLAGLAGHWIASNCAAGCGQLDADRARRSRERFAIDLFMVVAARTGDSHAGLAAAARRAGRCELYAKPSDRWEVNEVGKLCPEVVAGCKLRLTSWSKRAQPARLHR